MSNLVRKRLLVVGLTFIYVSPLPILVGNGLGQPESVVNKASSLIEKLRNEDIKIRRSALNSLIENGIVAVPALIEALQDSNTQVREGAAIALGDIGDVGSITRKAVLALSQASKDTNAAVRKETIEALGKIGPKANASFSVLIEASQNSNKDIRWIAIVALTRIGIAVIPNFEKTLKGINRDVQWEVNKSLEYISALAKSALINALNDKSASVRGNAARVLKYIGPYIGSETRAYFSALSAASRDTSTFVRGNALEALGQIGPDARVLILNAVRDRSEYVRGNAVETLGFIIGRYFDSETNDFVPTFIETLHDKSTFVPGKAARAIVYITRHLDLENANDIAIVLIEALQNPSSFVRVNTATALGYIGQNISPIAKDIVRVLQEALKDKIPFVRENVIEALGNIGPEAKAAVPALIEALDDTIVTVRRKAAFVLGKIGPEDNAAVSALIKALKDTDEDVRKNAAQAIGIIKSEAKDIIPALIEALNHENENVRWAVAEAMERIAIAYRNARAIHMVDQLEVALKAIEGHSDTEVRKHTETIRWVINFLEIVRQREREIKFWEWIHKHFSIISIVVAYIGLSLLCFALLLLRPLWLMWINDALKPYLDFILPEWLGGIKIPARYVLLVGFFHYHPRVLDAWVAKYLDTARNGFHQKSTVKEREVHVAAPVICDGETIPHLAPKHLRRTFNKKICRLLIYGEGGVGKTSLACQIAKWAMSEESSNRPCEKHAMLPVLIEDDLGTNSFTETIRRELRNLIVAEDPISEELLRHLLKRRRVLVIVDHFSEMSETTQDAIRLTHPEIPVNALVITSRSEEKLGTPNTTIKPIRIQGNRLSSFMEAYLIQRDKRDLFEDSEYFGACQQLSLMVGKRDITVLLAKLYADQMISSKEGLTGDSLPNNIPNLMLRYLDEINRRISGSIDHGKVQRIAKIIAWECLKNTFRPTPANRDEVLTALCEEGDAEVFVEYFEKRLRLIQITGSGHDQIRFNLDPLAEYLASLHIVYLYRNNEKLWHEFLIQADSVSNTLEAIKSFLMAVQDCCRVKSAEFNVPDFVLDEIGTRINSSLNLQT